MWNTKGKGNTDITMCEGDYGVQLPFVVAGITIQKADTVRFTIKDEKNGTTIFSKAYTNIAGNTIDLSLTEAESAQLGVGTYVYCVDWYKNGIFMYNLVNNAKLKVEDKI